MTAQTALPAILVLADGTVYHGKAAGKIGTTTGEICFNTGMTGYQEIFTDPSYFGQLMVTTNAHIGNYGIKNDEIESDSIKIELLNTLSAASKNDADSRLNYASRALELSKNNGTQMNNYDLFRSRTRKQKKRKTPARNGRQQTRIWRKYPIQESHSIIPLNNPIQ